MIDHWLADDGMKAIERMGWPERRPLDPWPDDTNIRMAVCECEQLGKHFIETHADKPEGWSIDNHTALCLLRNHAREWLEQRRDRLPWWRRLSDWFGILGIGLVYVCGLVQFGHVDTDAALIAAVLAAGE